MANKVKTVIQRKHKKDSEKTSFLPQNREFQQFYDTTKTNY